MNDMSMKKFITRGAEFESLGITEGRKNLFQVCDGVSVTDSLQWIDTMLSAIEEQIHEAGMGNQALEGNQAWLCMLAMESSRSVLQSVIQTMETTSEEG